MFSFKRLIILLSGLTLAACEGGEVVLPGAQVDDRPASVERVDQSSEVAESEQTDAVNNNGSNSLESGETNSADTDVVVQTDMVPASGAATITDVVLVTGQSNALGSETTYDPQLDRPVDGFYAYTDDGWQPANLNQIWDLGWHPAKGLGDDPHNNFGFHFGKTVAQQSDRVVGIILVTAPGEGISHWDADGFFFRKIRNKVLLALNELPYKSKVDGILWHQGETDWGESGSSDPDLEEPAENDYYSHKLWGLINNFRTEVWFDSERPFICGETARSPINARLNALNRDNDTWTACVPGEGLPTYDEERVHFTAESLRQLGASYADIYLQMKGN